MFHFSQKKYLLVIFILGGFCGAPIDTEAAKYVYQVSFDARYGTHIYGPPSVATNHHTLEYEQKAEYNGEWSSVLGFRAEVEAAYGALPERYGASDLTRADSQSFFLRDNYLQFKTGSFRTRVGYQQVVWGESFGFYFADIVNPKDYREGGLGGLSRNRLDIPMVNLQWIYSSSSFQLLYIPKPMFSLLPKYGSDFNSFKLSGALSNFPIEISREPSNPPTRGEYGLRITHQLANFDLSLFYFNYFDRLPIFHIQTTPSFKAIPEYKPLQSVGATLTADFDGFLVRSEIIQHLSRELNTLNGANLDSAKTNEIVYVLGLDLPPWEKWQIGIQASDSRIDQNNWASRISSQPLVSARLGRTFANNVAAEILMSRFISDNSHLLQVQFAMPVSSQLELLLGVDNFDGTANSEMGRYKDASRAWVLFRAFIKR